MVKPGEDPLWQEIVPCPRGHDLIQSRRDWHPKMS